MIINIITSLLFILISVDSVNAKEETQLWTDDEVAMLKTLTIDKLPTIPEDLTNMYVENIEAAELGHKIFFDKRFSKNGKVSCSTCHQPEKYFTDNLKTSKGISSLKRNAPTLVGINYSKWFFLDGRADSLWAQALGPFEENAEHGSNRTMIAHHIFSDKQYKNKYESIFGKLPNISDRTSFPENAGPVQDTNASRAWESMQQRNREAITQIFVNIGKAIAAYEHKLRPAASRFDLYVQAVINKDIEGMKNTLTKDEITGLKLFITKANCVNCHNGPMLSDFGFHNIGVPLVEPKTIDQGRKTGVSKVQQSKFNCYSKYNDAKDKSCNELTYIVVEEHATLGAFRTPSLRNVSKTSPYMHSGQYKTLADVLKHYNLNKPSPINRAKSEILMLTFNLSDKEQQQIIQFLKALDSEIDTEPHWLKPPEENN